MLDSGKMGGGGGPRRQHSYLPTAPFDLREGLEEVRKVHHLQICRSPKKRWRPCTDSGVHICYYWYH